MGMLATHSVHAHIESCRNLLYRVQHPGTVQSLAVGATALSKPVRYGPSNKERSRWPCEPTSGASPQSAANHWAED